MTVVKHKDTGKHYIFLGASYTFYKDSRPSFMGGTLFPHEEQGEYEMAAVSDDKGVILWFPSNELTVIKVDSLTPNSILGEYQTMPEEEGEKGENAKEPELCPACGEKVGTTDRECPSCGLTLISDEYMGTQLK